MENKKILTVGVILAIVVMLVSTFALAVSTNSVTGKVTDIFGKEEKITEAEEVIIADTLDSVDIYDIEKQVQLDTDEISPDDDSFRSRKMVRIQGFAYNDDESLAGLINGIWLKSTVYLSNDEIIESLTKGKIKIAEHMFDVERISGNDDEIVFKLSGKNSVGTLSIELDKSYNGGRIKSWKGNLIAKVDGVDYKGNVLLFTKENHLKPKPKPIINEPNIGNGYEYSGYMNLDELSFKIQSLGNPAPMNIDFQVFGRNNVEGKFALRLEESSNDDQQRIYNGKILIYEIGDLDDRIEGTALVTVKRDKGSNQWNGEIVIADEVLNEKRTGEIQIIENKNQKSAKNTVPQIDSEFDDYEKDSKSGKGYIIDKNDIDSKIKEKGLFERIKGFFGIDK
jgi:hypothetical protein